MWGRWFRRPPLLHVAGDTGTGQVVVLLHGIASSSATWQNVTPLLATDHRCILIDLLGFGGSPAPADSQYRVRDHARSLHRTLRRLRLRQPYILVGHSLGALIATHFAARFRTRIARMVLVSPPVYLSPSELGDDRERFVQDVYLRAYDFLRTHRDFTVRNSAVIQQLVPIEGALEVTPQNWTPFVRSLEQSIESQTTISDLAAVKVPVEIVIGDFDEFSSPGAMRIVERFRGVTVHRVWGATHLILPNLARAVAAAVRSPMPPVS